MSCKGKKSRSQWPSYGTWHCAVWWSTTAPSLVILHEIHKIYASDKLFLWCPIKVKNTGHSDLVIVRDTATFHAVLPYQVWWSGIKHHRRYAPDK